MAKKEKRISINALEKVAKEQFPATTTEQWFDIEVTIKRSLPLPEMLEFVKEVVDASFLTDGTFVPEVMDFALKSGVLTHYANFTLPENLEKQYWLIYSTGAFDMVIQHINSVQLQEIVNSVNRKVEHICNSDILALRARLEKLVVAFDNMEKQTAGMFDGMSSTDVQTLLQALGNAGTLSEEKIVDAYINRMKADAVEDDDNEESVDEA